jgi:ornithine cyclodeaminase/alanine dehydrogenase-like protein (mu-crystallin family)
MRVVSADEIDRFLDFPSLIDELHATFARGDVAPARHHHAVGGSNAAVHLLMPAWSSGAPGSGRFLGTKIVNIFRDNGRHGLPAVLGTYLLQSGETGAPLAVMEGTRLTHWRTAAASALAARLLVRPGSRRLLMVGAGALAPFLVRAHAVAWPLAEVSVWNHRAEKAHALAAALRDEGLEAQPAPDLQAAVNAADVISCATLSTAPLVHGAWLRPGQHVDLVGAFTFGMREVDDAALQRSQVFVDTEDALEEGGDVAIGLRDGVLPRSAVKGTLYDLCREGRTGRASDADITLFKSTGTAIEDLAAATLAWQRISAV